MRKLPAYIAAISVAVTLTLPSSRSFADTTADPAVHEIEAFYTVLVDIMKRGQQLGIEGRYNELKPITEAAFDLPGMTQLSVGPSWSTIAESDRKALIDAFERMTVASFAKNFGNFGGEKFVVSPEAKTRSSDKIVESKLLSSDGSTVPFNYRLHSVEGQWKIVDVYLNGTISQLALRRSDFSSTVAKAGPSGLVAKINAMVDKQMSRD
jgi:phospholipid transport system substrate-binding protein